MAVVGAKQALAIVTVVLCGLADEHQPSWKHICMAISAQPLSSCQEQLEVLPSTCVVWVSGKQDGRQGLLLHAVL